MVGLILNNFEEKFEEKFFTFHHFHQVRNDTIMTTFVYIYLHYISNDENDELF